MSATVPVDAGKPRADQENECAARLRVVVGGVRPCLVELRAAMAAVAVAGDAELPRALAAAHALIDAQKPRELLARLDALDGLDPRFLQNTIEDLQALKGAVHAVCRLCETLEDGGRQRDVARLCVERLDAAIVRAGRLTIPHALSHILRKQFVGGSVVFDDEFADALPEREKRDAVLAWLAVRPRVVQHGLVDEKSRRIYRTATPFGTIWRVALVLLAPAVAGALVYLAFWLLNRLNVDVGVTPDSGPIVLLFACVLTGATFHIGLLPKNIRFDGPMEPDQPGSAALWLSLRWTRIIRLLIPVMAVAAGLWVARLGLSSAQDVTTAVLAGYSADSLWSKGVDKFLENAGKIAETTSAAASPGTAGAAAPIELRPAGATA